MVAEVLLTHPSVILADPGLTIPPVSKRKGKSDGLQHLKPRYGKRVALAESKIPSKDEVVCSAVF